MIGIVDLGSGNVGSLSNALSVCGHTHEICRDPGKINSYEKAILPGVGAFGAFSDKIRSSGWLDQLIIFCESKKPFLGICVGMQVLLQQSAEAPDSCGLSLIQGTVNKLDITQVQKLPHVGWNNVDFIKQHPLFEGIPASSDFYFTHSYFCDPKNSESLLATTDYFQKFASVVGQENLIGVQFHPEKSQTPGMQLLKNFCDWQP